MTKSILQRKCSMQKEVPIWEKSNLLLEEAAVYSGIKIDKLRKRSDARIAHPFLGLAQNAWRIR